MRYYTKEWYTLLDSLGTADMFEPVIDKEYTDEEISALYQDMLEKYVQEERDLYDEPPYFVTDDDEDWDLTEEERKEELEEYENREPFDEEEAAEEFEEEYRDNLAEPDEDIPQWVIDAVDPRLIAMGLLPEKVYLRLTAEEAAREAVFDKLDEKADEALEEAYGSLPEELQETADQLDDLDGEYVTDLIRGDDGSIEIVMAGWDEDGEPVRITAEIADAAVLEDEGLVIEAGTDEDGDIISSCSLENHELYYEDGIIELHFMFDCEDHGLRYLTLRCSGISFTQEHI